MIKVGIVGVPGAGKTTLSRALAAKCRGISGLKHVELVQEYARRYIAKHGDIVNVLEQYRILEKQIDWEDTVCNSKLDIMITDSPIFLGFLYCIDFPKNSTKEVMFFNDIFKKMSKLNYPKPRYDIIFHLRPTIKPVNDGIRPKDQFSDTWRKKSDMMIQAIMTIFKPKKFFILEQKNFDVKVNFCIKKIKEFV